MIWELEEDIGRLRIGKDKKTIYRMKYKIYSKSPWIC